MRPVTLSEWTAWGPEVRQVWLDGLLERLPPWLVLLEASPELPVFEDSRHGLRFALAPEATVIIGLTQDRLEDVNAALARHWLQLFSPEVHLPARRARVGSHLTATEPMVFEGHEWVHRDNRDRLRKELAARSWRLPSEAEWELEWRLLRTLTPIRFGQVELCADDWHIGYAGAPIDGTPWGQGADLVRQWEPSGGTVDAVMPGRRPIRSASITQVRPVIDVPF